jgi:RNA polymerase sigma factor (sigma-70 family)
VPLSEATRRGAGHSSRTIEDRMALRKAINGLPQQYRDVILLRFAEGMQFNEIAELTGQNLEATKSLFRRAVSALRNTLDE